MGHGIESNDAAVYRNQRAWHGLGDVIPGDISAIEAADRYLPWPVLPYELAAHAPGAWEDFDSIRNALELGDVGAAKDFWQRFERKIIPVHTHRANIRVDRIKDQDVRSVLWVVGAEYATCQNRELAEFTDALAQSGRVVIESAGSLHGGKRVWFLARGESFNIGGADEIYPYMLISNSHDGTSSIRVTPTTIRVVCANTLSMVIPNNEAGVTRAENAAWIIRHTGQIANKLESARQAILYYEGIRQLNQELFEQLRSREVSRDVSREIFAKMYAKEWRTATEQDLADPDTRAVAEKRIERMDTAVTKCLARLDRERSDLGGGGNLWLTLNAFTGYLQHDRKLGGKDPVEIRDRRINSNLFGAGQDRTQRALREILAV